ncbi:MAG: uracil-DNA glycosylase [Burkholderiaceae bacterium]
MLACQRCALAQGRTQVVFGSGPAPAPWMVVGEAPGEQEDLQGTPFVGPAGQLLDQMLAAIDVDRAREVFVANVLKCRPPRNRDPQPDEVAKCSPWLQAQIAAVRPRIILAVGRFAAQTLLQTDTTIGKLRGVVHALPQIEHDGAGAPSIPVVVTYHPSYLLRSPSEKGKAWQDLLLARGLMNAA